MALCWYSFVERPNVSRLFLLFEIFYFELRLFVTLLRQRRRRRRRLYLLTLLLLQLGPNASFAAKIGYPSGCAKASANVYETRAIKVSQPTCELAHLFPYNFWLVNYLSSLWKGQYFFEMSSLSFKLKLFNIN